MRNTEQLVSESAKRTQRAWTTSEMKRAAALWQQGQSLAEVAGAIGRDVGSLKHVVGARRDLFPRRRHTRSEVRGDGEAIALKFSVSKFLHRAIKAEAEQRHVSQCMVIRDALREAFIRKQPRKAEGIR